MKEFIIEAPKIDPSIRHSFIFNKFDELAEGDSIVIVNNHDPKPLLHQFGEQRTGQFAEEYLEKGPSIWKLKIMKKKSEGCCGFCS